MNIKIFNFNNDEWYIFDVNNTTTMKDIKEKYSQQLNLDTDKLIVWISSMINKNRKKEWIPEADHLTLAECNILIPEAKAFIIIKSF
jgi:hypothetical protein